MLVGAVQARLIQSLKALIIFGADGAPGNAEEINYMNIHCVERKQKTKNQAHQCTYPLSPPECHQSPSFH